MKAKILVLGNEPLVRGMRLAGLEDYKYTSSETFSSDLEKALGQKEFGLIVVNESMLAKIEWKLKRRLETLAYPVIVPVPEQGGKSTEGEQIRSLIKRALGFDLGKK